jgi:hypothetical protein
VRPFLIFFSAFCLFVSAPAYAIKTAASFDLSYAVAQMSLTARQTTTTANAPLTSAHHLNSYDGLQLDYNVALFDYRTVASFSFLQFQTSTLGVAPISRIAFGLSYYLFRINGQRIILDNQVEGKVWGIAPALELSFGITKLSVKDPNDVNLDFTAGLLDAIPRLLIEIPLSSSFLLMLRAGTYLTLKGSTSQYSIGLSGGVFNIGFKLTTL